MGKQQQNDQQGQDRGEIGGLSPFRSRSSRDPAETATATPERRCQARTARGGRCRRQGAAYHRLPDGREIVICLEHQRVASRGQLRPFAAALLATAVLAGCASASPSDYVRDHTADAEVRRDFARCELQARRILAGDVSTVRLDTGEPATIPPGGSRAAATGHAIGQGLGYGLAMSMRRAKLRDLCMESLGYHRPQSP